jgi:hypothetical protein
VKRNEDTPDGVRVENVSTASLSAAVVHVQSPVKSYIAVRIDPSSSSGWSFGTAATTNALEMKYGDDFSSTQPPVSIAQPSGSSYPGLPLATSALRVDSNGRVGVGIDIPLDALHVQRDTDDTVGAILQNVNTIGSNAAARLLVESAANAAYIGVGVQATGWSLGTEFSGALLVKPTLNFTFPSTGTDSFLPVSIAQPATSGYPGIPVNDAALSIDYSGKVGVGTTTPMEALHVKRNDNFVIGARVQNVNTGGSAAARLLVESEANAAYIGVGVQATGWSLGTTEFSGALLVKPTLDFSFPNAPVSIAQPDETNGYAGFTAAALRIDSIGRVGLGTSSPTADLHVERDFDALAAITVQNLHSGTKAHTGLKIVSSTQNAYVAYGAGSNIWSHGVRGDDGRFMMKASNGNFDLGGPSVLVVQLDGNVGIGDDAPTDSLSVYRGTTAASVKVESKSSNSEGNASLWLAADGGRPFVRLQATDAAKPANYIMGVNSQDFLITKDDPEFSSLPNSSRLEITGTPPAGGDGRSGLVRMNLNESYSMVVGQDGSVSLPGDNFIRTIQWNSVEAIDQNGGVGITPFVGGTIYTVKHKGLYSVSLDFAMNCGSCSGWSITLHVCNKQIVFDKTIRQSRLPLRYSSAFGGLSKISLLFRVLFF